MTSTRAATIFAALGEPTRCEIVQLLALDGSATQKALTERFDLTRQAIAKHLSVLERAEVVRSERSGRERKYALDSSQLTAAQMWIRNRHAEWDERLSRLGDVVNGSSSETTQTNTP